MSFYEEIQALRKQRQYEDNKEVITFIQNDMRNQINNNPSITYLDYTYDDLFTSNKSLYIETYFTSQGFKVTKINSSNNKSIDIRITFFLKKIFKVKYF